MIQKSNYYNLILYIILIIGVLMFLLPFFWMLSTSLKPTDEIYMIPPKWIPSELQWNNYSEAWNSAPFIRLIGNTLFVAVAVILGQLITGIPAGYAFARLNFPGKNKIFLVFLMTLMIPNQVRMIPLYVVIAKLGWVDSFKALIFPGMATAFNIFILREFFKTIPYDLEDAAKIDGCGRIETLIRIMLPLSKPVISVIIIFNFFQQWNNFFWPLIVINSKKLHVMQLGLSYFSTTHGAEVSHLMVASLIAILPVVIVFSIAQRTFIQGITLSGMKG